jgi:hypothetical protein
MDDDVGDGGPRADVGTKACELDDAVENIGVWSAGGENVGVWGGRGEKVGDEVEGCMVAPVEAGGRSGCGEPVSVNRVVGEDTGGVEGTFGRSLENRLVVFTLIPALFSARMRSAMLPPDATLGPSSSWLTVSACLS